MRAFTLALLGALFLHADIGRGQELVVAEGGKSAYRIVVSVNASIQDFHAAQVLQQHITEISGVTLPIVGDDNAASPTEIIVGSNRHTDELDLGPGDQPFGPEEFELKTVDQRLVILGGSPRGVLYGVNSLLTDQWGCRWFTPLLKRIPKQEHLTLAALNYRYSPPFEWREAYFWSGLDNEWSFHNFQNKDFAKLRPEQGWRAGFSHSFMVHTILTLVPPERYLESHPDYFWTGKDDQPRTGFEERKNWIGVCLNHPDVPAIAAEALLQARRDQPEGDLYYALSAPDYPAWCECERCKEAHRAEAGGELPEDRVQWAHGADWLRFAAKVQKLLAEHPDAPRLSVMAYGYTPEPPAVPVMHPDLNVTYAELSVSQFHALNDPKNHYSQEFRRRLDGWSRSAGSVYVWLYRVDSNAWCWPHPNMHTFAEDLRYLRDAGVKGVFAFGNQCGWWGSRFDGEMNELRAYLLARLMWNPDLDWRELRREFCEAYFGVEAGAVIERYLDDLREEFVKRDQQCISSYEAEKELTCITPEMIARWQAYMDEAESLAEDEEHKKLVRIARLPIMLTAAYSQKDPDQRKARLQDYLDTARGLGAASLFTERGSFETWAQQTGLRW